MTIFRIQVRELIKGCLFFVSSSTVSSVFYCSSYRIFMPLPPSFYHFFFNYSFLPFRGERKKIHCSHFLFCFLLFIVMRIIAFCCCLCLLWPWENVYVDLSYFYATYRVPHGDFCVYSMRLLIKGHNIRSSWWSFTLSFFILVIFVRSVFFCPPLRLLSQFFLSSTLFMGGG